MSAEAMTAHSVPQTELQSPASDILEDVDATQNSYLARMKMIGDVIKRKVYYLAERSRLPLFRLGTMPCARKSVLLAFIASQEERAMLVG